jgi:5-methylcytosine-specific restriction endonuclease McrA
MKICPKCGKGGPFHKSKYTKDGLSSWCSACYREYNHQYRSKNIEKELERVQQYHKTHLKESRERARQWRKNQPEKSKEIAKRTRKNNYGRIITAKRFRRALKYGVKGSFTNDEWENLKTEYGNRCAYCNSNSNKVYADHIIPISRGGPNDISNIVPACKSCNSSKQNKPLLLWMYMKVA